jgi:hypothetical protein
MYRTFLLGKSIFVSWALVATECDDAPSQPQALSAVTVHHELCVKVYLFNWTLQQQNLPYEDNAGLLVWL